LYHFTGSKPSFIKSGVKECSIDGDSETIPQGLPFGSLLFESTDLFFNISVNLGK
jgi:hypothetical protein